MASNEDIDDYMSDALIPKDNNDIRPSLLFTHNSMVKHKQIEKKLKSNLKPKKYYQSLENQLRETGLKRALDSSNKGFKLLQKMGFKSDLHLDESVSQPIRIQIRNDRRGLGCTQPIITYTTDNEKKRKQNKLTINDNIIEDNFRNQFRNKNQLLFIEKDLKTCQRVCQTLDIKSGIDEQIFKTQTSRPQWFWPQNDEEMVDCEQVSQEMQLLSVNHYLREKYFYCIWCGIEFNNSSDMNDNCLGSDRISHQLN